MATRQSTSKVIADLRGVTADSFRKPLLVPAWWRGTSTFLTLLLLFLRDFVRSPWVWFNVGGVVLAHLVFFGNTPSRGNFFSVAYVTTLLLSALSTSGIFSRANHRHTYPILARRISKTSFVAAGMLASWIMGMLTYVLTGLLVMVRYKVLAAGGGAGWLTWETMATGSVTIAVGAIFAVALMTLLSNFVSSFLVRMITLAVMTISVMAFDPRSFPIENLQPIMARIPPLFAPVIGAIQYASNENPDTVGRASVLTVAAFATTITGIIWWLSARGEVVVE
jgi:hypothetical protein